MNCILISPDLRFLCDIAALFMMGSIAVAIDLGSLGNTLHILAFDLGSSGIDFQTLECMGGKNV